MFVHGSKRSVSRDPDDGTKAEVTLTTVDDKLRQVEARGVPRRKKRRRSGQHRPARPRQPGAVEYSKGTMSHDERENGSRITQHPYAT